MGNLSDALIAAAMTSEKSGNSGGSGGESIIAWKPVLDAAGNLSWIRTSSTTNPGTQNIKGDQGEKGDKGDKGDQGIQGEQGEQGAKGTDGVSPSITITDITGGHRVTITDAEHPGGQSFNVMNGKDGEGGTVDQTYDATSTNAQSGVAVAQAIAAVPSAPKFAIKSKTLDNVTINAGARLNHEIAIINETDAAAGFQIVGFKRIFINNATNNGANRDAIALQSFATGSNSTKANIAVRNEGTAAAKIKIEVDCLCMKP